jgi:hypothetical protein
MAEHGQLPPKLQALRQDLDALKTDESGATSAGVVRAPKDGAA